MEQNIDDFFTTKNTERQIDTSNQQQHWNQLQLPKVKAIPYKAFAAVALLVSIIGYILCYNNTNNKQTIATTPTTTLQPNIAATLIPTTDTTAALATINNNTITTKVPPKAPNLLVQKPILTTTETNAATFYIDLTKAPEVFTIDPNIENAITCSQGGKLLIPASSIVNDSGQLATTPITLTVQEYYQYSNAANPTTITAGMIKYKLYNTTEELYLQPNKTITILMNKQLQTNIAYTLVNDTDALNDKKINELQWVSNEKFVSDNRQKIDYIITMQQPYKAATFMSQIAFEKNKELLPGNIINNSVVFGSIPKGESIYFISMGKVGDKYFYCNKKIITGTTTLKSIDFIEISKEFYTQKIELFNKLSNTTN